MMLAAALLMLQAISGGDALAQAPELMNETQEVTVIAGRLQQISVAVSRDARGAYQCGLSQSTGLLKLDGALCKATTQCVRQGKDGQDDVRACVDKARPTLTARIRDYMRTERRGAGA